MATKRSTKASAATSGKGSEKSISANIRTRIMEVFASHWAEEGEPPRSVARFSKDLGIAEADFYRHFPSLHAVEKAFWNDWMTGVIGAVEEGKDWKGFTARERYLAFLFAMTQSASDHRSLLLMRFGNLSPVSEPASLAGMRGTFLDFARGIVDHGLETGEIADRRGITGLYPGILHAHLRWVIDQYLNDESEGFERTDAFIEKTVTLAFDLFRSQALDSAADLIRFLLPANPWSSSCRRD